MKDHEQIDISSDETIRKIHDISVKDVNIMVMSGIHMRTIMRYGIEDALPGTVHLVPGPCNPASVTTVDDIDRLIDFSEKFGDVIKVAPVEMMNVPGTRSTLEDKVRQGADIQGVYSPIKAVDIARSSPGREVVYYAVGFDASAPTVASAILLAQTSGVNNFSVLSLQKLIAPAIGKLATDADTRIDGFICPAHLCSVTGAREYEKVVRATGAGCIVTGFELPDLLNAIRMIVTQVEKGESSVEIASSNDGLWEGDTVARDLLYGVFNTVPCNWRGLGLISGSGLAVKNEYIDFDAEKRFTVDPPHDSSSNGCRCGDVVRGLRPVKCGHFYNGCTPESPMGPCMTPSDGACTVYYNYRRNKQSAREAQG